MKLQAQLNKQDSLPGIAASLGDRCNKADCRSVYAESSDIIQWCNCIAQLCRHVSDTEAILRLNGKIIAIICILHVSDNTYFIAGMHMLDSLCPAFISSPSDLKAQRYHAGGLIIIAAILLRILRHVRFKVIVVCRILPCILGLQRLHLSQQLCKILCYSTHTQSPISSNSCSYNAAFAYNRSRISS